MSEAKTYTIKRSEWNAYRASGLSPSNMSLLYNPKYEDFCCVGIMCKAEGVSVEALSGKGYPRAVLAADPLNEQKIPDFMLEDRQNNSWLIYRAVHVNDAPRYSPIEKEALLTQLFAEHNITLIFED